MRRPSSRPSPPGEATRERILDAAEACFAENGVGATSVRAVTAAAGVNLAAVHYHFGGKEELVDAVLARRIAPINSERLALLERACAAHAPLRPPVPVLLEALLRPVIRHAKDDVGVTERISRILARCEVEEPDRMQDRVMRQFQQTAGAFLAALVAALPNEPPAQVHERFRWTIGVMTHTLAWRHRDGPLPFPLPDDDPEALLQRMIAFLAAGFAAPAPRLAKAAPAPSKAPQETRHGLG